MHSFYLDAIRNFEGYTPQASWDYAQYSNGYGTKAQFPGEVIDRVEAEKRFRSEVSQARAIVEKAAPDLDEGTKAALTSLTYNAGTGWIGSGLGDAVRSGDLVAARDIFMKYNKAGGEVLPGLVNRRTQEALWIGNPDAMLASGTSTALADAGSSAGMPPVVVDRDQSARQVAALIRAQSAPQSSGARDSGAAVFERKPESESRVASVGIANEALAALVDVDLKGAGAAEIVRLAQLGRGSELAKTDKQRQDGETRRI
jgi:lysozyme